MFDRLYKVVGSGCLLGEVTAFFTADRLQAVGLLVAGGITWGGHLLWSQRKEKRKDHDEDKESIRRNFILDALAAKLVQCVNEDKPFPMPDVIPLLIAHRPETAAIAAALPGATPAMLDTPTGTSVLADKKSSV